MSSNNEESFTGTHVINWNSFWQSGQRFVMVAQLSMHPKQNLKFTYETQVTNSNSPSFQISGRRNVKAYRYMMHLSNRYYELPHCSSKYTGLEILS